jgi:hypothetical protein
MIESPEFAHKQLFAVFGQSVHDEALTQDFQHIINNDKLVKHKNVDG